MKHCEIEPNEFEIDNAMLADKTPENAEAVIDRFSNEIRQKLIHAVVGSPKVKDIQVIDNSCDSRIPDDGTVLIQVWVRNDNIKQFEAATEVLQHSPTRKLAVRRF